MDAFVDLMKNVPPPFNMVVYIVLIVFVFGFAGTVVKQLRKLYDHEADRRLKRDMIDAGYTIDDAERLAELEVTQEYQGEPKRSA